MPDEIGMSKQGEVAFIHLRRAANGNALRSSMFDELRKVALALGDAPPRFVVLTADGPDFCVGLDPSDDRLWAGVEPLVRARDAQRAQELAARMRSPLDALARLPCPVIAAIEGRCLGAGLELALVADVRVAAKDATFGFTEGRSGVMTGFGALSRGAWILGMQRVAWGVLTGEVLSAEDAVAAGLVAKLSPSGGALSAALEVVTVMRRVSPVARQQHVLGLRAIQQRLSQDLADAETQAAARAWIGPDWQAARLARNQGKEPSW